MRNYASSAVVVLGKFLRCGIHFVGVVNLERAVRFPELFVNLFECHRARNRLVLAGTSCNVDREGKGTVGNSVLRVLIHTILFGISHFTFETVTHREIFGNMTDCSRHCCLDVAYLTQRWILKA